MGKMIHCKMCGAEIAKNAKTCPKCGGRNQKPIYLRMWFIVLMIGIHPRADNPASLICSP